MKKRSLNFKLIFVMLILVSSSVGIAGLALHKLAVMNATLKYIVEGESARVSLVKDIKAIFFIQLINEKNFILEEDAKERVAITERMMKRHLEMSEKIKALSEISSPTGKEELNQFHQVYDTWWGNITLIKEDLAGGHKEKAKHLSMIENRELRKKGETIIESTVSRNEKHMLEEEAEMEKNYAEARSFMIYISLLGVFVGGSIGSVVLVGLNRSVGGVIENLSASSSQVSAASDQIATASIDLSEATTEQASSLEETVATMEELSSMVKVTAENAAAAASLSNETSHIAVRGEQEMQILVSSMDEISKDSRKISDIMEVIDNIAFQTNLLALNAAVEAARAGEQGKGFAVVADAVRALSQKSSIAAKDINDLIRSSVGRIAEGSEQAKKSGSILGEIVLATKKVSHLNQEIAVASSEQSNGINQIGIAMNQLDQVTQVNAASSEEAAASAEELSAQAKNLSMVIETLVEAVHGQQKNPNPTSAMEPMSVKTLSPTNTAVRIPDRRAQKLSLIRRVTKAGRSVETVREAKNNNEDLLPLDPAG